MKKFKIAILILIIIVASVGGLYIYDRQGKFEANIWSSDKVFSETDYFTLKSTSDSYKMVQMTDLHLAKIFGSNNNKTLNFVEKIIDTEKPNLVVVTGDLTLGLFNRSMLRSFADFMDKKRQLWAYVLGNHDFEWGSGAYRYLSVLRDYEYCLFDVGYTNIGFGNKFAIIKDKDDNPIHTLTFLDTSEYKTTKQQADWYKWGIKGLNTSFGTLDNTLFMHIPMQVVREHMKDVSESISPLKQEPYLYEYIKELNQTKIIASGHDHLNDYRVNINGIEFVSCPSMTFGGYFRKDCARAVYIYDIYADRVDISHKTQYDYGIK